MPTSAELFEEQLRLLGDVDTGEEQFGQYGNVVLGQRERFGDINRGFREATTKAGKSTTLDKIMALATAAGFVADATSGNKAIRSAAGGKASAITASVRERRDRKRLQARQDFQDQLSSLSTEAGFDKSLFDIGSARRKAGNVKTSALAGATGDIGKQKAITERSVGGPSIAEQKTGLAYKTLSKIQEDNPNMSENGHMLILGRQNPEFADIIWKARGGKPEDPEITESNAFREAMIRINKRDADEFKILRNDVRVAATPEEKKKALIAFNDFKKSQQEEAQDEVDATFGALKDAELAKLIEELTGVDETQQQEGGPGIFDTGGEPPNVIDFFSSAIFGGNRYIKGGKGLYDFGSSLYRDAKTPSFEESGLVGPPEPEKKALLKILLENAMKQVRESKTIRSFRE